MRPLFHVSDKSLNEERACGWTEWQESESGSLPYLFLEVSPKLCFEINLARWGSGIFRWIRGFSTNQFCAAATPAADSVSVVKQEGSELKRREWQSPYHLNDHSATPQGSVIVELLLLDLEKNSESFSFSRLYFQMLCAIYFLFCSTSTPIIIEWTK